ncbi:MAG: ATPase P [Desulforegulaceae bacterium]|nr:ATPase P [Desulforegulaceae bacterium]
MIKISIPGIKDIEIENILLDYNGTIATDGEPLPGIKERFEKLSKISKIHLITADTHGSVKEKLKNYDCKIKVISGKNQDTLKLEYLEEIGKNKTAAIGNGLNDRLMLKHSKLGICIIGEEGAFSQSIINSDLVVQSPNHALDLFLKKNRLTAGLRNE